uniref:Uncharacterized protein n=1 Tax=Brassica campestris TaxID=3711 RepID=M4FDS7_BRACM
MEKEDDGSDPELFSHMASIASKLYTCLHFITLAYMNRFSCIPDCVSLYAIVFPTRYSDIFTSFVSTPGYTNLDTFAAINLRTEPLRFRTGVCLQHLHEVGHLRSMRSKEDKAALLSVGSKMSKYVLTCALNP